MKAAADRLRQEIGVQIPAASREEHENFMLKLREKLGEKEYETAWNDGRTMPLDQVILLATKISLPTDSENNRKVSSSKKTHQGDSL